MNSKKHEIKNEIWRPVKGFELYEVSDQGRMRNVKTGRVFTGTKDAFGYIHVRLIHGDEFKLRKLHRLVAEAFIDNPDNKPIVDHINNDKSDNRAVNLRWCTYSENQRYFIDSGKYTPGSKVRKIAQYDMKGKLVATYGNTFEASAATGIQHFTIYPAAKGMLKTAGGYMWRFFEDTPENEISVRTDQRLRPVIKQSGDSQERFESVMSAAKSIKESLGAQGTLASISMTIRSAAKGKIKSAYGFKWIFE